MTYQWLDSKGKQRMDNERRWLSRIINSCIKSEDEEYQAAVLSVLNDLLSLLPTRRFVPTLIEDHQLVLQTKSSPFLTILEQTLQHPVNSFTAAPKETNGDDLTQFQLTLWNNYRDHLEVLALYNHSYLSRTEVLESHLSALSKDMLTSLCEDLGIRPSPYMLKALIKKFSAPPIPLSKPTFATEKDFDTVPDGYTGAVLPLPKLGNGFLSLDDYLKRNIELCRLESVGETKSVVQDAISRDWSRFGADMTEFVVHDIGKPQINSALPTWVEARGNIDVGRMRQEHRVEWESMRRGEILFLTNKAMSVVRGAEVWQLLNTNCRIDCVDPSVNQTKSFPLSCGDDE